MHTKTGSSMTSSPSSALEFLSFTLGQEEYGIDIQ
ncbi:MAG: hypothetical protein JWP79_1378, partial [Polaromonas sp.]|nr:hypothetical protein [Polaromonas sp.]